MTAMRLNVADGARVPFPHEKFNLTGPKKMGGAVIIPVPHALNLIPLFRATEAFRTNREANTADACLSPFRRTDADMPALQFSVHIACAPCLCDRGIAPLADSFEQLKG
jgi:hypothetical protein